MQTLEEEIVAAHTLLSRELKTYRKVIDIFLLTTSELEQNLEGFRVFLKKLDITEQITVFLRDVSIAAINYEAHFLNNFQKLLWRLKEYLNSLPKEQKRQKAKLYAEIELNEEEIERYKEELHNFAGDCLKAFSTKKGQVLEKEEIRERLDKALATLAPFAKNSPKEVLKQLSSMGNFIADAKILIRR